MLNLKRLKKLIPMAMIMIMLSTTSVFAAGTSSSKKTATVTSSTLNVRTTPKVDSKNGMFTATKGSKFEIVGEQSGWYKIKVNGNKYGWISSKYVQVKTESPVQTAAQKQASIVKLANAQIGKPYVWGATGPKSFDCSGLTKYVYKSAVGITIPRTSVEQSKFKATVKRSSLKPGDLIFSSTNGTGKVSHVGIYVGNGQMIHSPRAGSLVQKTSINTSYWNKTYLWSKRVI